MKKRYWGRHFWARGYFCATLGQMTAEMIKQYLEHHFEPRPNDDFKTEPEQGRVVQATRIRTWSAMPIHRL